MSSPYPFNPHPKRLAPAPPLVHITTTLSDDAPSIAIDAQYVDSQDNLETQYTPPMGGQQQQDLLNLYSYRNSPLESECYSPASSPSSVSSSPFIGGSSPNPDYFSQLQHEPDHLSLDFPTNGGLDSDLFGSRSPSVSFSEMSLSNTSHGPNDPNFHLHGNVGYNQVYLGPFGRNLSMPDMSSHEPGPSNVLGINQGLRRANSSSSFDRGSSQFLGDMERPFSSRYDQDQLQAISHPHRSPSPSPAIMNHLRYDQDQLQAISHPHRSPSPGPALMNHLQELIDGEIQEGQPIKINDLRDTLLQAAPAEYLPFLKPPKTRVASSATRQASDKRRTHQGHHKCPIEGCTSSFTRRFGLKNHVKSHMGIADLMCQHCRKWFPNSLARHEKRCKQNPDRDAYANLKKKNGKSSRPL